MCPLAKTALLRTRLQADLCSGCEAVADSGVESGIAVRGEDSRNERSSGQVGRDSDLVARLVNGEHRAIVVGIVDHDQYREVGRARRSAAVTGR